MAAHTKTSTYAISQNHPRRPGSDRRKAEVADAEPAGSGASKSASPTPITEVVNSTTSVGRRARGAAASDEKNLIGIIALESRRLPLHRDPWRDPWSLWPEPTF